MLRVVALESVLLLKSLGEVDGAIHTSTARTKIPIVDISAVEYPRFNITLGGFGDLVRIAQLFANPLCYR